AIFELLYAEEATGIALTESYAMTPPAAVCGLYFSHREARYFAVNAIGKDQVESYAKRKGMTVGKWKDGLGRCWGTSRDDHKGPTLQVDARPERFVSLYGTTPPRADAGAEAMERVAARLIERVRGLSLDGLVVYDVQDEAGRTSAPRPFPFLPTIDPCAYSRRLREMMGKPTVTYKCVADMTEERWASWLTQARRDYGIDHLSVVGLPSSRGVTSTLPLPRAIRLAAAHPANFTLGGVVIAERHGQGRSESRRMLQKAADGCSFFISQAVYDAGTTIRLLTDYVQDCAREGVTP